MTLAPTTPPPPLTGPTPPPPPSRAGAGVVAIVLVVLGALVAVSTVGWSAVGAAAAFAVRSGGATAAVAGVSELRVDVSAADLLVVQDPAVADAVLTVTGRVGAERWTLEREGSVLVVTASGRGVGDPWDDGDVAVLTLPADLDDLDADFRVDSGDLDVDGDFGDVALSLAASSAEIVGTAESIDLTLDSGQADIDLAGVDTAVFDVSIGDLTADLGGGQPASVVIDASTGEVDLTVAPGEYRLTGDMTDSDLVETDLSSSADAASTIHADVADADVTVWSGR